MFVFKSYSNFIYEQFNSSSIEDIPPTEGLSLKNPFSNVSETNTSGFKYGIFKNSFNLNNFLKFFALILLKVCFGSKQLSVC